MPLTLRRSIRIGLTSVAAFIALLAIVGFTYEQLGRNRDAQHRFRVGRAVDIGGRTLNIDCSGEGSPTVILLPTRFGGYGGYMKVRPEVAKFARVCWYDRAGEGWSDPPPFRAQAPQSPTTSTSSFSVLPSRPPTFLSAIPSAEASPAFTPVDSHPKSLVSSSSIPVIPIKMNLRLCLQRSIACPSSFANSSVGVLPLPLASVSFAFSCATNPSTCHLSSSLTPRPSHRLSATNA